jgi:hypothetical protein
MSTGILLGGPLGGSVILDLGPDRYPTSYLQSWTRLCEGMLDVYDWQPRKQGWFPRRRVYLYVGRMTTDEWKAR